MKNVAFWRLISALVFLGSGLAFAQQTPPQPNVIQQSTTQQSATQQDTTQRTMPHLNVHELAHAVDEHYNHLRSLEGEFTETYSGNGTQRQESGTLWLKKPRKMRWEYRSPKEKLFLSDGQSVWFYVPAERQARKADFKKLDDLRSPIAFLLGKTKLENELQGLSKAPDQAPNIPGDTVLRGVPKGSVGDVSEVQLEVSPSNQILRIVLIGPDGGTTEFRFMDWKENVELSDTRFHFIPPPGVETVEGALGP
ncbi:MAG: outer membrane lipoprotein chaperone LolA [Terriglobales bacterium]